MALIVIKFILVKEVYSPAIVNNVISGCDNEIQCCKDLRELYQGFSLTSNIKATPSLPESQKSSVQKSLKAGN